MSDVHIHHLEATYRVPRGAARDAQALDALRERLDRIATNLLAADLESIDRVDDPALYFVERLDVTVRVAPGRPDAAIAGAWSGEIRREVGRSIADETSVVVFANRSVFVAAFLADLLHGRARGVWYYREFARFLNASPADAAAALLTDQPDVGRDALIEMAKLGEIDRLLAGISDAQAALIAGRCLLSPSPFVLDAATAGAWVEAVRRIPPRQAGGADLRLIHLYTAVIRERPALGPDANLARFLRCFLYLTQVYQQAADRRRFIDDLMGRAGPARRPPGPEGLWLAQVLAALGPGGRESLAAAVRVHQDGNGPASAQTATHFSPFAGLLLLVPAVVESDLVESLRRAAEETGADPGAAALLLYPIGRHALGMPYDATARTDPAVRMLAGLASPPDGGRVEDAVARGGIDAAGLASQLVRRFAGRLNAFADSSDAFLRDNFLFSSGRLDLSDDELVVRFEHCPLRVVLQMAGFGQNEWVMAWFGGRRLSFRFD